MKTALRSFIRNYKKRKLIYTITIGGFSMGMAIIILIGSFIYEEKNVNYSHTNINQIYRVVLSDNTVDFPERILPEIITKAPEIEKICLYDINGALYQSGNSKDNARFITTDEDFFDIFSIQFLKGIEEGALKVKQNIVLTKSFANKLFGDNNSIGEIIKFQNGEIKTVVAVIQDPPKNSSLRYDAVINREQEIFNSTKGYNEHRYKMYESFIKLNPQTNPGSIEKKICDLLLPFKNKGFDDITLGLQPLKDVYFNTKIKHDNHRHANVQMINLLSVVAFIILFLAGLNYVNLSTASNKERQKEIGIRKTSGAKNTSIFGQFIIESYLASGIAILIGVALTLLFAPAFRFVLEKEFNVLEVLKSTKVIIAIILFYVLIGGITGLIPAILASLYNPQRLVQQSNVKEKVGLRGTFITLQFVVSIVLIICLVVISKQVNYVKSKNLGFDKEHLISLKLQGNCQNKSQVIIQNLRKIPSVKNATATHGVPFAIYSQGSGSWGDKGNEYSIDNICHVNGDTSFLSTYNIPLLMGRNFRPTDKNVCFINEKTLKHFGWKSIEGKTIWDSKIIGVVKDFHFKKMHQPIGFFQLKYNPKSVNHITVRIDGKNIPETMISIESAFKQIEPELELTYHFYDEWVNSMYKKEERQAAAVRIFAIIAIVLSLIGLFGMVETVIVKRIKEIGVRKVNGAKVREILILLNGDFLLWIIVAFLIACPVAYYFMDKWLQSFAYQTEMSLWVFIGAGVVTALIAIITISWQSINAAKRNPVESLRYE